MQPTPDNNQSMTDTAQLSQTTLAPAAWQVMENLQRATEAAFALLAELTQARAPGDEWTRLPSPAARCPVSHFSRAKIKHLIQQEKIRTKTVEGGRFYSLSDMRALIKFIASQN